MFVEDHAFGKVWAYLATCTIDCQIKYSHRENHTYIDIYNIYMKLYMYEALTPSSFYPLQVSEGGAVINMDVALCLVRGAAKSRWTLVDSADTSGACKVTNEVYDLLRVGDSKWCSKSHWREMHIYAELPTR